MVYVGSKSRLCKIVIFSSPPKDYELSACKGEVAFLGQAYDGKLLGRHRTLDHVHESVHVCTCVQSCFVRRTAALLRLCLFNRSRISSVPLSPPTHYRLVASLSLSRARAAARSTFHGYPKSQVHTHWAVRPVQDAANGNDDRAHGVDGHHGSHRTGRPALFSDISVAVGVSWNKRTLLRGKVRVVAFWQSLPLCLCPVCCPCSCICTLKSVRVLGRRISRG